VDFKKIKSLSPLEVRIIEESIREFREQGYFPASVDMIAERAGIGKATIYRHFGKKITLFFSTVVYIMYNWEKEYEKIGSIEDFDTALKEYVLAGLRFNEKHGDFIKAMVSEERLLIIKNEIMKNVDIKVMYAYMIDSRQRLIDILTKILEKGKSQNKISPDIRADLSAELIFMTLNQFFHTSGTLSDMKKAIGREPGFSMEEGLTELKKLILRGLGVEKTVGVKS
jgi:AcrR family transcriptional regulator